jgi:hypothetical protein
VAPLEIGINFLDDTPIINSVNNKISNGVHKFFCYLQSLKIVYQNVLSDKGKIYILNACAKFHKLGDLSFKTRSRNSSDSARSQKTKKFSAEKPIFFRLSTVLKDKSPSKK